MPTLNSEASLRDSETRLYLLLFGLLLATDVAFILVHLLHEFSGVANDPRFSLGRERGYPDVFQYVKEYWIVLVLGLLSIKRHSWLYLAWSALFGYLLLDDSVQIHETLGTYIGGLLPLGPTLGQTVGEMAASIPAGLLLLVVLLFTYRLANQPAQQASRYLLFLLGLLLFFGIFVDAIHNAFDPGSLPYIVFTVIEDGGELLVMSCIVLFVLLLARQPFSASLLRQLLERSQRGLSFYS